MTVKELKEQLNKVDENLEVILEYCVDTECGPTEGNDLVLEIATNDKELYLVGESCGDVKTTGRG